MYIIGNAILFNVCVILLIFIFVSLPKCSTEKLFRFIYVMSSLFY